MTVVQYSTPGVFRMIRSASAARLRGALQRGGVGELDDGVDVPLVLLRQEAAGNPLAEQVDPRGQSPRG